MWIVGDEFPFKSDPIIELAWLKSYQFLLLLIFEKRVKVVFSSLWNIGYDNSISKPLGLENVFEAQVFYVLKSKTV